MKHTVLITKENPGHFRAVAANLPHCQVQADTRDQALSEIRDQISRFLSQTEMVQLEIPSTNSPNSSRLASVGCVRRVFLRRNAPLLEFLVTFFSVVLGKMGGKMVRYAIANAPYLLLAESEFAEWGWNFIRFIL